MPYRPSPLPQKGPANKTSGTRVASRAGRRYSSGSAGAAAASAVEPHPPAGGPKPHRRASPERATNVVKLTLRDKETAQEAVRRFRKLVERSGIKKEMRIREFYEKPSATKRRAKIRAQRRTKRERTAPRG
jgi:small subunit ribosomal protein S21